MRKMLDFVNQYINAEVNLLVMPGRVKVYLNNSYLVVSRIFDVPTLLTSEHEGEKYPVFTIPFREFYRIIGSMGQEDTFEDVFGNILERVFEVKSFKLQQYEAVHEEIKFGIKPPELKRELFFLRPFAKGDQDNVVFFRFKGTDCNLLAFGSDSDKITSFGLRKLSIPGMEVYTETEQDRFLSLDLLYDFLSLLDPKRYAFFYFGGKREPVTVSQEWTMNIMPIRPWIETHELIFNSVLKIKRPNFKIYV
ncbi:MAG: hypothetical protein M1421_00045 [Candidatus Eremiobacteraeota bacterium]|nr:hypothetical protein [Candidatus Eremiobacteraeota bacterium]